MATTVTMPQLGETVTEGTILSWVKQVGDTVSEDDMLVEISTDKVDTEVPSPASGVVLEILVPEGETVPVGTPLCVIGEAGEERAPAEPAAEEPEAEPEPAPAQVPEAEEPWARPEPSPVEPVLPPPPVSPEPAPVAAVAEPAAAPSGLAAQSGPGDGMRKFLSPVVRKLAREHNVDLGRIAGTGAGGRITRRDVESFLAAAPTAEARPVTVTTTAPPVEAPARAVAPAEVPSEVPTLAGDEVIELDRLRARIGENMIRAKLTAAHVWTSVEVDYEALERVRQAHREAFKAEEGFSLTYLPFIARATVDALKAFPVVNSSFYLEQRKAVFHRAINLGIAVDLNQKGLIVATVRNAESLRLIGLARGMRELADKARAGKLEPDDVTGSTFTITNPGPYGSFMSAPIINVPNTGILATDTVTKRPTVITSPDGQDTIGIRHIGYLGLTWDHRAFDGSTAVLFLRHIKDNLETWDWEQELA
jgi:2-oxoglutarate dehydrogenase E2 component (dihydrolipoamide succinyltransferase)